MLSRVETPSVAVDAKTHPPVTKVQMASPPAHSGSVGVPVPVRDEDEADQVRWLAPSHYSMGKNPRENTELSGLPGLHVQSPRDVVLRLVTDEPGGQRHDPVGRHAAHDDRARIPTGGVNPEGALLSKATSSGTSPVTPTSPGSPDVLVVSDCSRWTGTSRYGRRRSSGYRRIPPPPRRPARP